MSETIDEFKSSWNFVGQTLELFFPGSTVKIPIFTGDDSLIVKLPIKRFWAIRVEATRLNNSLLQRWGINLGFNIPLPKQSIDQWWHAIVAPIDKYVDGSEYWFYQFQTGDSLSQGSGVIGEWYQGLLYNPVRRFGCLGDGPTLIRNIGILTAIIALFIKLGLSKFAASLYAKWVLRRKHNSIIDNINDNEDLIRDVAEDLSKTTDTVLKGVRTIVNGAVGLRLRL